VILAGICVVKLGEALYRDAVAIITVQPFIVAAVILLKIVAPRLLRQTVMQRLDAITDEHIQALVRHGIEQIRGDPYGKPILDKRHSEVDYFVTHHVTPRSDE
jgi:hypothetical protein